MAGPLVRSSAERTGAPAHRPAGAEPATSLPPGPRLPGWLQSIAFALARERFAVAYGAGTAASSGSTELGVTKFVMVRDTDPRSRCFTRRRIRRRGQPNASLRPLVGESSLFLLDGDEHLRARRMLLPWLQGDNCTRAV